MLQEVLLSSYRNCEYLKPAVQVPVQKSLKVSPLFPNQQDFRLLYQANIQEKYNLVTLLIGVNDQYRGRSVESFRTNYIKVLDKAIALANNNPNNVIVVSIPDWGVSPFAASRDRDKISQEIDLYNSVKNEETIKKQVRFINITAISRQALNNELYIADDNLHFSGAMYKLWADEILNKAF